MSEALILPTTNPQYDDRLFIELRGQNMKIPCSELYTKYSEFMYATCSQHVLSLEFSFTEQYVVILWVSWYKNKYFWKRFTCTWFKPLVRQLNQDSNSLSMFFTLILLILMFLQCIKSKNILLWPVICPEKPCNHPKVQ